MDFVIGYLVGAVVCGVVVYFVGIKHLNKTWDTAYELGKEHGRELERWGVK